MQIKIVALFLFITGTLKGYHSQVFDLCSSITSKNYTACFLNYTPKQRRSYLDKFTMRLVDDCSHCHRHWVLHSFYLWLVFSPSFFHSLFSHSQYLYRCFIPLLQCFKLYYQLVFHFSYGCLECPVGISRHWLDPVNRCSECEKNCQEYQKNFGKSKSLLLVYLQSIDVLRQVNDARFIQLTKHVSVCVAPLLCANYKMINCPK